MAYENVHADHWSSGHSGWGFVLLLIQINARPGTSIISEPIKMEAQMSRRTISWRLLAAVGAICLLGACAQNPPQPVASNPPPVAPGLRLLIVLATFLLAISACVVEPFGRGGRGDTTQAVTTIMGAAYGMNDLRPGFSKPDSG
jgi:hypothetical protein